VVIPVLLYHSVARQAAPGFAPWTITPERFDAHMRWLAGAGYRALTVSELAERLRGGRPPESERVVAITFDDGLEDFYTEAWPILRAHELTATVFVTTGHVGGRAAWLSPLGAGARPMMSWAQVAEVAEAGIECGAHTLTHPQLDTLWPGRARAEIAGSRAELERVVGRVGAFAYPHGYHARRVRAAVREAGFACACACGDALAGPRDDLYAIPRITVPGDWDAGMLAQRIATARPAGSRRVLRRAAWRTARRAGLVSI
jgi:peptidoglycan/xylan/chitin deacetylase (PgdA/CDA1 family)